MNVYTSYFSNIKNIPGSFSLVSIAGKDPDFTVKMNIPKLKMLVPKKEWVMDLKASGNTDSYRKKYYDNILNKTSPGNIICTLLEMGFTENVVLLCWEGPNRFCHRQLVMEWWIRTIGEKVMKGEYAPPQIGSFGL